MVKNCAFKIVKFTNQIIVDYSEILHLAQKTKTAILHYKT